MVSLRSTGKCCKDRHCSTCVNNNHNKLLTSSHQQAQALHDDKYSSLSHTYSSVGASQSQKKRLLAKAQSECVLHVAKPEVRDYSTQQPRDATYVTRDHLAPPVAHVRDTLLVPPPAHHDNLPPPAAHTRDPARTHSHTHSHAYTQPPLAHKDYTVPSGVHPPGKSTTVTPCLPAATHREAGVKGSRAGTFLGVVWQGAGKGGEQGWAFPRGSLARGWEGRGAGLGLS
ncbi:hypothetical protein GWK47_027431 [Chionoecetes opilio]|uniref:Uncharacterized protein n=1 Tax=Chionoecetes opilio TaxID=41210 RepID=A0A8J8W9E7_CHIOP|nr:hypothetical protein GWK47_027431 [Chionoecetes opilio]